MAPKALLDGNPGLTREEIQRAIDGDLYSCTGYNMTNEAVQDPAKRMQVQKLEKEAK